MHWNKCFNNLNIIANFLNTIIKDNYMEVSIMVIENTPQNRIIADVAATLAIEDMFPSKKFIKEMISVAEGEKSTEQLRQEIIAKYAR